MNLFIGTGKAFKDENIDITRQEYSNGYTLFCFNMTSDLGESDHFNLIKSGSVRLKMAFAEALPNTINVVVYAEFHNVLKIEIETFSTTTLPKMLYTDDSRKILERNKRTASQFKGVSASDELPYKASMNSLYVCITNASTMPGEYWIVIYFDNDHRAEYFDSFGLHPLITDFETFLNNNSNIWKCNVKTVQHLLSDACGYHCVFLLYIDAWILK